MTTDGGAPSEHPHAPDAAPASPTEDVLDNAAVRTPPQAEQIPPAAAGSENAVAAPASTSTNAHSNVERPKPVVATASEVPTDASGDAEDWEALARASKGKRNKVLAVAAAVLVGFVLFLVLRGTDRTTAAVHNRPAVTEKAPGNKPNGLPAPGYPNKDEHARAQPAQAPVAAGTPTASAVPDATGDAVPGTAGSAVPDATGDAVPGTAGSAVPDEVANAATDETSAAPAATGKPLIVRVDVNPPDAHVAHQGKTLKRPWMLTVLPGKKVILEIARPGFITRRIVVDGSKSYVRVGMVRKAAGTAAAEPTAPTPAPESPSPEPAATEAPAPPPEQAE